MTNYITMKKSSVQFGMALEKCLQNHKLLSFKKVLALCLTIHIMGSEKYVYFFQLKKLI